MKQPLTLNHGDSSTSWGSPSCLMLVLLMAVWVPLLTGCGGAGYAGNAVPTFASSHITIDGGQQIGVALTNPGNLPVQWVLGNGAGACSAACGTLSSESSEGVTFTAPQAASQTMVTLQALLTGTSTKSSTTIVINPAPAISGVPPAGTVGVPYSATLALSGGTGAVKWGAVTGSLPAGLSFDSNTGTISGTPTSAATSSFAVQAVDQSDVPYTVSASKQITITNVAVPLTASGNAGSGVVGVPYMATLQASGGTAPYTWSVLAGALPAGLSLSTSGIIAGTPTAAGSFALTAQVKDAVGATANLQLNIAVTTPGAALMLTSSSLPDGTVGTAYNAVLGVTGGAPPYTCSVVSGSLPTGLSFGANCAVTGTPTVAGTFTAMVRVVDSGDPAATTVGAVTVAIHPAAVSIALTTSTLPDGTVNTPYAATVGVSGGTGPYACALLSGSLPPGLSFGPACTVVGVPTTAGTFTATVRVTDSSNPVASTTGSITIVIHPAGSVTLTLVVSVLPDGTVNVPYSAMVGITGGTGPYVCSVVTGSLPTGLSFGPNCAVTGTPTTAGAYTAMIRVTDSGNAAAIGTGTVSVLIKPAVQPLTLTTATLPDGTVNVPYLATVGVNGGTAPYTCSLAGGSLPTGLSFGPACTVAGTPTTAGTYNATVRVTDSSNPAVSVTGPLTIVIKSVAVSLTLTVSVLPDGTVNTPYSATVGVAGGTAPYTCTVLTGALPTGLSFGPNCNVAGTPTKVGTYVAVIRTTDSATPANTGTGTVTVIIKPAGINLLLSAPAPATVGTAYSALLPVTGGTAPYTCSLISGPMPAGLTLNTNCQITGTPTAAGISTVLVQATDSSSPAQNTTAAVILTVLPASVTMTVGNPPAATVNTPYTGSIPVTGGTAPYTCTVTSGSLPAGLAMGSGCTITGTPTAAGTTLVGISVTDSASPAHTSNGSFTITVNALAPLTLTGSLPNATVSMQYTQTLHAAGGLAPYTYAVTAGSLPAGLSLSTDGVVSGTPTAVGANSFTITVTDSEPTPQKANLPLLLQVVYPASQYDSLLQGAYAFLFQGYDDVVAGVLAYQTATVGSFNADGAGLLTAGELDSNHQTSNPTGNTVSTANAVGAYTVGADGRGTIAVSTLNADGTVAGTTLYAIALKLPASPATVATSGSLIEADGNTLVGTKGSGTLLAQTTSAFANGLSGSYAFGLSGDTPCLPSCTVGIAAGPVAAVGQFNASGGTLSGTGDANIASTNYPNSTLAGTYAVADSNGRVQVSMSATKLSGLPYPRDFAVYVVDASHAFVMSTDKHSASILQAGTATLQTQTTFSNASLNGGYIGYENAAVNPGLVGTTLSNVLNLSSATIFRGTGNSNGTCTTTNVDVGGLTGLVSSLTALGSNSAVVNALLGTYQSLGNSTCAVNSNGRTVLNYASPNTLLSATLGLLGLGNTPPPPRVVYLTAPNAGYFLETGYAGLGRLEAQTGSPFTVAGLDGSYVYGSIPASTLVTVDGAGSFTADGKGNAITTLDENVGVGTVNALQLGVTSSTTYSLTDATAGRYLLGGTRVLYAITPGRYVLLDTDALSTSPYVALLF